MRRQEAGPGGSRNVWHATLDPGRMTSPSAGGFHRTGTTAGPASSSVEASPAKPTATAPPVSSTAAAGYRRSGADAVGPTSSQSKFHSPGQDLGKFTSPSTGTGGGYRRFGDVAGPASSLSKYVPTQDSGVRAPCSNSSGFRRTGASSGPLSSSSACPAPVALRSGYAPNAAAGNKTAATNGPLGETNIGNLGSPMELDARKAASATETCWNGVGQKPGLVAWRIEKFKVVPVPENSLGSFYGGDSYIVLHTYEKNPGSRALAWDIHFWLGETSSQDEIGTAAYKSVELDDFLGGEPVEHREVMGHESELFLSYFPHFRIMEGGIDSGFNKVKPESYKPRLLQLKGKKNVRLREVPLSRDSLNEGDVFVLDLGLEILIFHGSKSSVRERMKAGDICRALQGEREGRAKIVVFGQNDPQIPEKWTELLGSGAIKSAEEGGDDAEFEKNQKEAGPKKLFRVSDASGTLRMDQEAEGPAVPKFKLDGNDVFLLDANTEIWVWIGSKTTAQERKSGIKFAEEYIKQNNRPVATPISRCLEGSEPKYFFDLLTTAQCFTVILTLII